MIRTGLFLFVGFAFSCSGFASPQTNANGSGLVSSEKPPEFEGIGITEKLGDRLDLSIQVRNEQGVLLPLSSYFAKGRPVILSLIYFNCPGLCNFHLNGVFETLKESEWTAGQEFELLVLSFDAKEGSELAQKKKDNYLKEFNQTAAQGGIHFLTADQASIDKFTSSVGFQFKWNEKANEWAHSSAAILISPEGKIARYLHGIQFDEKTLRLALGDAAQGKVGTLVDQLIWYCFKYDPSKSQYTIYAFRLVQVGAILIVLILAALILPVWLKNRRKTV